MNMRRAAIILNPKAGRGTSIDIHLDNMLRVLTTPS
jgi:hypothetical protein